MKTLFFLLGLPPKFLASRGFASLLSRVRALPLLNLKKKRDYSQSMYPLPRYITVYVYLNSFLYLFCAMLTQVVLYLKFANHSSTVSENTCLLNESRRLTETR